MSIGAARPRRHRDRHVGTGAEALAALRENRMRLRRARPAAARHERLRGARADPRDDALSDVPVVVFTGKELSAEEDAQLHTMARSIVVKGVESPERLLDETSLFLHRVITELPPREAAHARAAAQLRRGSGRPHACCWSTTTRATSSR
jgi:CheY-like chemotaxis protein